MGEALGVIVGNMIGVTVANEVGEGDEVTVEVGARVGVGYARSPNPPQAIRKRLLLDMMSNIFLVIASRRRFDCGYASAQREALQRMIQIPENPQTF